MSKFPHQYTPLTLLRVSNCPLTSLTIEIETHIYTAVDLSKCKSVLICFCSFFPMMAHEILKILILIQKKNTIPFVSSIYPIYMIIIITMYPESM